LQGVKVSLLLEQFIAESIERFIEDQAFSPSYDLIWLLPHPLLEKRHNLLMGEGEWVG
jgi:hypothetical protein